MKLACKLKTPIIRDSRTREVTDIYEPELPTRLYISLIQLGKGIALVQGKEEVDQEIYSILYRVCLDSCPRMRVKSLGMLFENCILEEIRIGLGGISEATVRRLLEDLELSRLVTKEPAKEQAGKKKGRPIYIYQLSSQCRKLLEEANPHASITASFTSQ